MELTNEFHVGVPVDEAWTVLTDVERIAPCLPGAELQEVAGEDYRGVVKVKVGPITAQYKGQARFVEKDDSAHRAVLRAEGRDTRGQGNANATITASLEQDGDGTAVRVVTDLTVTGKVAQFGRGVLADVSTKLLNQFVECLEKDLLAGAVPVPDAPPVAASTAPSTAVSEAASMAVSTAVSEAEPVPVPEVPTPDVAPPEPEPEPTPAPDPAESEVATSPADVPEPDVATSSAARAEPEVRRIDSRPATPVDLLDAAGVPMAKRAIPLVAGVLVILWFLRRRRGKRG